jgi:serine/threonine protein kinase
MALYASARLGPYEILAPLGAGGMGEVWKARDTRLDRLVAIKTIHGAFSERFEREARAISALNHPHICALYDVGEHEGAGYLVMEYVEGAALKGPLLLDQTLKYAAQICDALDAAHRKGIVHRDLKPDNILVTKAGVKLLDFGLAKLTAPPAAAGTAGSASGVRREAEIAATKVLTGAHVILGTPQYMAPEQIEGRDADARTDIFAFGCVLYEVLTGQKAFEGKTPSSTMAAILATEPRPMRELQPVTPASLERTVKRALAKDPDDRWQTARDLKAELEWIAAGGTAQERSSQPAGTRWLPWILAGVCVLVAAMLSVVHFREKTSASPGVIRLQMSLPENFNGNSLAMSPDGRRLAFQAPGADGKLVVWLRSLDSLESRPVAGTESGPSALWWSPDSRFVAYWSGEKLKRFDVSGGPPQAIADIPQARGGTWNRDGVILTGSATGILRVSAVDGTVSRLTALDRHVRSSITFARSSCRTDDISTTFAIQLPAGTTRASTSGRWTPHPNKTPGGF